MAFSCLIPMLIRMAFVQVIILYGTNNALAPSGGWSEEERRRREIGSRLVLASRVFYAATYVEIMFHCLTLFPGGLILVS